ncbi:MAG: cytochrome c oxidase assembly protein [Trueperaceae bacterium]
MPGMFIQSLDGQPLFLSWQFDPVLLGSLITATVLYSLAVGPLRHRLANGAPFNKTRAFLFFLGMFTIYAAEGSPLHDLSERYSFSSHMVQHLILNYVAAPLLIWGCPTWLLRVILLNRVMKPVAMTLSNAVLASLVFNIGISLWHIPQIYDAGLQNSSLHHFQHIIFLTLSVISWWPVMSRLDELPRLGYGLQILYLFITSTVLQIPLFGILTFANQAFYQTYMDAPRVFFDNAADDQAMAGVIMKVLGMIIYAIPLIVIFYKWYAESQVGKRTVKQVA